MQNQAPPFLSAQMMSWNELTLKMPKPLFITLYHIILSTILATAYLLQWTTLNWVALKLKNLKPIC